MANHIRQRADTFFFHPRFESADKVASNGGTFIDQTGVDLQQTGAGGDFFPGVGAVKMPPTPMIGSLPSVC